MCEACRALERDDALQLKRMEMISTLHNPCAPVTHYACRCRECGTEWLALEVYDEDGVRPSEWSWEPAPSPTQQA